jgi:hypothetical protein
MRRCRRTDRRAIEKPRRPLDSGFDRKKRIDVTPLLASNKALACSEERVAMTFRITGLSPEPFRRLYGLSDQALDAAGVQRIVADEKPGFPDRVELREADPGQTLLLLNYTHQPAGNAYRSSHAIYVLEGAASAYDRIDEIPEVMRIRPLSLRAFDSNNMIVDADLVDGRQIEGLIERLFANSGVAYIHAHYARRGCYAGLIERA